MLFCAQNLNLRKDFKMRKIKLVFFIFLIFMFVLMTIPAYASDTKKITSINIQRVYKAKEGEINPDQVSFKPGRSEYTITYQGMYDVNDLPIGSYMDYRITLNAKKGYNFEWLKERNCLSDSGTIQGLSISADYSSCSFILHSYPLPMVLTQPQQLRWNGTVVEWDPVEHADSYHVTIYTIEKDGRLTQRGKELTCTKTSINAREILYSKPGDYIFKIEAASDQTYLYTSKKAELAYNHSKYLSAEDIGYYTGYWQKKNDAQLYKLASSERSEYDSEYLISGRYLINGDYYTFNESGERLTGWQSFNGQWTYHDENSGRAVRGWFSKAGKKYFFDPASSIMATGWRTIDYQRYYFDQSGAMVTGWQKIHGKIYLFYKNGSLNLNTVVIQGKTYSFQSDGSLIQ